LLVESLVLQQALPGKAAANVPLCSRTGDSLWAEQQGLSSAMESFPSPLHTLDKGGHRAGEAADYGAHCSSTPTCTSL
jgi:hypothetical protein